MTEEIKKFLLKNKENFEDNNWNQIMYNVEEDLYSVTLIVEFRDLLKKLGVLDEVMTSTTYLPGWFFCNDNKLTFINIPSNIKRIGYGCFDGCRNLTEVVLDEGIETIEEFAFNYCPIKRIKIPESIKSVEDYAFLNNYVVEEISVPLRYISKFTEKVDKVEDWFSDMTDEEFEKIRIIVYG